MEFNPRVNQDNPDPRIACVLLLDTSYSMNGARIDELNRGFGLFCEEIKKDELARKRAEVAVVTFGGGARLEVPFTEGRHLQPRTFHANGDTPMGSAVQMGLELIQGRKHEYRQSGLEYFRPWLFVITDGEPTDDYVFFGAAEHLRQVEAAKGVSVFPVGVGREANLDRLRLLSAGRSPVMLDGLKFREFFQWMSSSLSAVSTSNAYAGSEAGLAGGAATEQIPLPPATGWTTA
ncbi:VWA domain-containing protein [Catellatospora sp. NPDC049111]|uniref:vWA domain-containing protein n=1 Tax=Catellatospora sp. NPDC049111 TaxID=3155271 RepID=UPI0033D3A972